MSRIYRLSNPKIPVSLPVKVLIDTNVVLDLLLEREPCVEIAIALFDQIEQGNLEGNNLPIYSPTELLNQL